jgi:hypothetical protein
MGKAVETSGFTLETGQPIGSANQGMLGQSARRFRADNRN